MGRNGPYWSRMGPGSDSSGTDGPGTDSPETVGPGTDGPGTVMIVSATETRA